MIWPSERQKGSTIDLSPLPKLFVFAANSSFGAAPAYEQSVRACALNPRRVLANCTAL